LNIESEKYLFNCEKVIEKFIFLDRIIYLKKPQGEFEKKLSESLKKIFKNKNMYPLQIHKLDSEVSYILQQWNKFEKQNKFNFLYLQFIELFEILREHKEITNYNQLKKILSNNNEIKNDDDFPNIEKENRILIDESKDKINFTYTVIDKKHLDEKYDFNFLNELPEVINKKYDDFPNIEKENKILIDEYREKRNFNYLKIALKKISLNLEYFENDDLYKKSINFLIYQIIENRINDFYILDLFIEKYKKKLIDNNNRDFNESNPFDLKENPGTETNIKDLLLKIKSQYEVETNKIIERVAKENEIKGLLLGLSGMIKIQYGKLGLKKLYPQLEEINDIEQLKLIINYITKEEKIENIEAFIKKWNINIETVSKDKIEDSCFNNLILIKGGSFEMGSNKGKGQEKPAHPVTLSSFYINKYQVTQLEFQSVMGFSPSIFRGENNPVESLTWFDAVMYCNNLSNKEGISPYYSISNIQYYTDGNTQNIESATVSIIGGKGYRLPTEAEWEYAAKGGNKSKGYKHSGSDNVNMVAWYRDNSGGETHPVGTKKSNELGLYDMSGNVCELCWDFYEPLGIKNNYNIKDNIHISRGGSWNDKDLVELDQYSYSPSEWMSIYIGFRIVKSF